MSLTSHQKKIILMAIGALLLFILAVIVFTPRRVKPATLEIWGIIDKPEVFSPLISQFHKSYPQIQVKYVEKDSRSYQEELLQAFANDEAPDIFMLLGNWIPEYQDKIAPLDTRKEKTFNIKTITELYPDVVIKELLQKDKLWGIPLYVDTLALFYNKDIFDHYNIALPPQTWEEILQLVPKLRILDQQRNLLRSAIALGTANNINWSTDILSALMMQYGSSIVDASHKQATFDLPHEWLGQRIIPGEKALRFYTQFANVRSPYYTWNENKINSLLSFARSKTAMVIGYHRAITIFQKYNPQLNFGVAPLPQFRNSPYKINYASTMNLVVNKRSSNTTAAWIFLKFLAQRNAAEQYYLATHHPPARRDLIAQHLNDPLTGTFISQILSSKNWYQCCATAEKEILQKMIQDVSIKKTDPRQTVYSAAHQLNLLWKQNKR